jgi:hypothetical protein
VDARAVRARTHRDPRGVPVRPRRDTHRGWRRVNNDAFALAVVAALPFAIFFLGILAEGIAMGVGKLEEMLTRCDD